MASRGRSGSASMVAGLSPVKGTIWQSGWKAYFSTKYREILPKGFPPSTCGSPSFLRRSSAPSLPAERASSSGLYCWLGMSHRFMPHTSLISRGATDPRRMEASHDDTRDMREVWA
ncbi:hypothetical protein E5D57_002488 [Metarhizium anisopliae]|nr:hypothetical protein E5D57_002488 [Metarhizium anisopliae]